jgi:hypothetical protein
MELHVTFTGLCMFVPQPKRRLVHVLMPATPVDIGGKHVHRHDLTLSYAGGGSLDMSGWYLDLSEFSSSGTVTKLPPEVLDAGAPAAVSVDTMQFGNSPRTTVTSRITLPAATRVEVDAAKKILWSVHVLNAANSEIKRDNYRLVHELTWVIRIPDVTVFTGWQRKPLTTGGTTGEKLPDPHPSGEVVALAIKHVMPGMGPLGVDEEAEHFQAYYSIFGSSQI